MTETTNRTSEDMRHPSARLGEGAAGGPHIAVRPDLTARPLSPNIGEAARHELRSHSHLRTQRVWCEVDGGTLYLRGQVPRFFYKQLAQEAVAGIDGVTQIVNEIEVVW